jgi:hypothetical protein
MNETAIADHALIGDLQTAALVTTDGTVDWFCCPRFDSGHDHDSADRRLLIAASPVESPTAHTASLARRPPSGSGHDDPGVVGQLVR